ncbi:Scr1 family TA system antitoxin-like transcriptional regulator [Streptomyces sp. NPDC059104]|uniref:helix-turn-helix domain-containing protein n=1 Tax=Streptomyces sp. NPDC059104 TaxID=3346729 RepID=UPI0036B5D478
MVNIRDLDPSASPLDFYGSELRRVREAASLKQSELGKLIYCTGSLIGQIETARRVPTRDFSERVDAALGTGGFFSRLVGLVLRVQLPMPVTAYAELESRATYISTFQVQLINGLLQTPGYARAVLAARTLVDLDAKLEARLERRQILEREDAPLTWVVMGEAALHQEIGGREVMGNQLAHLLSLRSREWLRVQILPFEAGAHTGFAGAFTILRFEDDQDVLYTEDFLQGYVTANPQSVRESYVRYDQLQAAALSVEDSAARIARVMEERYGHHPGLDGRAVA